MHDIISSRIDIFDAPFLDPVCSAPTRPIHVPTGSPTLNMPPQRLDDKTGCGCSGLCIGRTTRPGDKLTADSGPRALVYRVAADRSMARCRLKRLAVARRQQRTKMLSNSAWLPRCVKTHLSRHGDLVSVLDGKRALMWSWKDWRGISARLQFPRADGTVEIGWDSRSCNMQLCTVYNY